MCIKMLALDMDDTLLKHDLSISTFTIEKIKALSEHVHVVLASGRVSFAMKKYLQLLGLSERKGYAICGNGSTIIESDTFQVIYKKTLDKALALEVYQVAQALGLPIQVYEDDKIYVSFENEYTDIDCRLTGLTGVCVENIAQLLETIETSKIVIPGEPTKLIQAEKVFKSHFGDQSNIFISKPFFLEIMPLHVDKGEALRVLAQRLGIDVTEVMAVGDAMNDYGMLKYAGIGVAMENAIAPIKEIADLVLEYSNEQDGVGRLVEKLLAEHHF